MTLTKQVLVENLIESEGMSKKDAKALVETFFETLSMTLENREEITLSGFGKFNILNKESRPGRNPKTLEEKTISARRVATFSASPILTNLMNAE
ncbi:integration host factor subunit alpha [Vibrio owensii]|uniref:integration host factor subunit alpha n=1 Tax=Vibrio harveyi group TaxID=717610 RepID=UPI003CC65FB0